MRGWVPYAAVLLSLVVSAAHASMASNPAQRLGIDEAAICRDVVQLEPVDPGTMFPSTIGQLYCYTRVVGAQRPTHITHVWFYGDEERARVRLEVRSPRWRTYSSKIIRRNEVGFWRVEVLGPEGEPIHTIHFEILR
jgi:hypothetical protein